MAETDDSAFYKDTEHCTVNCNLLLACCHLENAVDWMGPCWSSYLQLMVCTVVRGAWEVWAHLFRYTSKKVLIPKPKIQLS